MSDITINTERKYSATVIPNTFIDHYLADAHGLDLKVYLYLLRCQNSGSMQFSISSAADFFDETENDVKRALKHWEKAGVLRLSVNGKEISGITILDLTEEAAISESRPADTDNRAGKTTVISLVNAAPAAKETDEQGLESVSVPSLTRDVINKALENPEIKLVSDAVQTYLGRYLSNADLSLILFMYNNLHFSDELILHLYETCVGRNKLSNPYIQAVALDWAKAGVSDIESADRHSVIYSDLYAVVNKAFNPGRLFGDKEIKFIKSWDEMGMNAELVKEACDRALSGAGKPSFSYANKILLEWKNKGVKEFQDIEAADREFSESKKTKKTTGSVKKPVVSKSAQAYLNRFEQRDYSDEDMAEIERQLLKASYGK